MVNQHEPPRGGNNPPGYGAGDGNAGWDPAAHGSVTSGGGPLAPHERQNAFPMEDVEPGKVLAVLGYLISPIWIVPLITRDNAFALFHAKQALVLAVVAVVLSVPIAIIAAITCGVGAVLYLPLVYPWLMGLMAAIQGHYRPMPWIGQFAERYLGGLQPDQRQGVNR